MSERIILPAHRFIYNESVSGAFLFVAAMVAIFWANSRWGSGYVWLRDFPISIGLGGHVISHSLREWVNDGLMTLFFFVVALEVKRELVLGELSSFRRAALPVAAALGGMIFPAGVFIAMNGGGEGGRGWGIPMATDIAFAVGALAILGRRIPPVLRIFLLSYAVVDDIGAILVIALFYSGDISWVALGVAVFLLAGVFVLQRSGVQDFGVYWVIGILVWAATLESGVHATIAGVVLGAITPARPVTNAKDFAFRARERSREIRDLLDRGESEASNQKLGEMEQLARQTESPLERLERNVHPWVSFGILPIFALLNAGVEISRDRLETLASSPMVLGIVLGLVLGKPVGILGMAWLSVRLGLAEIPAGIRWRHIAGVGILGGIGFTVALFIAGLAFADAQQMAEATVGILVASTVAMVGGVLFLRLGTRG